MGDIDIRFKMNLETGKKDIVIEFHGDEDMMRHEHEKKHREIVQRLVGEGVLTADEVGEVTVERGSPSIPVKQENPPEEQREGQASPG